MSLKKGSGFILGVLFSTAAIFILNVVKERERDKRSDPANDQEDTFISYFSGTVLEPLIEQGRSFISSINDVIKEAIQEGQEAASTSQYDMEEALRHAHGTKSSGAKDDQE
ncbi:MAG: hypothetical protein FI725_01730 [SAR202 cluster bacterium]|nr:hypothetical protein [SAR202 cluster bacterium]